MWSLSPYLSLCSLLPTFVTSLALAPPNGDGSLTLTNPSSLSPHLNLSAITPITAAQNTSLSATTDQPLGNNRHVKCETTIYGHPPVDSCRDAAAQAPRDPSLFVRNPTYTFGPRGQGNWDYNLPKRFISSDGKCIYDFSQTSSPSHVNFVNDFIAPLTGLQTQCVESGDPPFGGLAEYFGREGNFEIVVRSYTPAFTRCSNTPPAGRPVSSACQKLIDTMNAGREQITFGAQVVPDVQVHLPLVLTDPTNTCALHIDIVAPDDKASWYDLWEAAVTLDGMCARKGRTGKSRFLGANRKITMEIKKS